MTSVNYEEFESLSEDDLFLLIGNEILMDEKAFKKLSARQIIEKAKVWFELNIPLFKSKICNNVAIIKVYENQDEAGITTALIDLIAGALTGIAPATAAYLLYRKGISSLCRSEWKKSDYMSTHSPEYRNAIDFLDKYKKAYSSISGLRNNITANEIVENLDKQLQDKDFLDQVKRKHRLDEEGFKEKYVLPFSKEDDYLRYLGDQIILHNNLYENDLVKSIPIGTLPTMDFNAAAIKTDIGNRIIVLNSGSVAFMQEVINSFLGTIPSPSSEPLWRFEDAAIRIIQWSTAMSTGIPKFGLERTPEFNNLDLMGASGSITDCIRSFIIGHEIGHFLQGHLNDSKTIIRQLIPGNNEYPIEYYFKEQTQEFEADLKGFELCINWCKETHGGKYQIAFLSIVFAFHLVKLLELSSEEEITELTHPNSELRRAKFDAIYSNQFDEQIKKEINYLDSFMNAIYSSMNNLFINKT